MFQRIQRLALFLSLSSLLLVGCAGVYQGSAGSLIALVLALSVGAYLQMTTQGCSSVIQLEGGNPDGGPGDGKTQTDQTPRDGTWERCCQNGKISTCFCPAGAACNYGWFTDCGNNTCVYGGDSCEPVAEVTPEPDASIEKEPTTPDGTWEQCCENGKISTCFCPGQMSCNYGMFYRCGDNTCVNPGQSCEPVDEETPDASVEKEPIVETGRDGTWERCCQNGKISTCFCPAGAECNYGWFTDCGNNTCVYGGDSCEPVAEVTPEPDASVEKEPTVEKEPIVETVRDGTWESCCQDGKISTCFCPAGVACNYGQFTACANNTCVPPTQQCP